MSIRAKFRVQTVTRHAYANVADIAAEEVTLRAVTSSDPHDPNHTWSKATPAGQLTMTISNPDAIGKLELGADYYLDFTKAD
jgi:hypothetical protein